MTDKPLLAGVVIEQLRACQVEQAPIHPPAQPLTLTISFLHPHNSSSAFKVHCWYCTSSSFSCPEVACVCRQAACKGCQNPTGCWTRQIQVRPNQPYLYRTIQGHIINLSHQQTSSDGELNTQYLHIRHPQHIPWRMYHSSMLYSSSKKTVLLPRRLGET